PVLTYFGGPMLQSVQAFVVLWGPNVAANTVANIGGFYNEVTSNGPYMQELAEYNVNGMTIGSGTFAGSYLDADAPAGNAVTDDQIQQELSRLIDTGKIPPNNGNNIYMV